MEEGFWGRGMVRWVPGEERWKSSRDGDRLKVFKKRDPNEGVAECTNKTLEIPY